MENNRKLEILLSVIALIFIILTYRLASSTNKNQEEAYDNLTGQLAVLEGKVTELLPEKPQIGVSGFKSLTSKSDFELLTNLLYNCEFRTLYSHSDTENYQEVRFVVSNEGKKTKNFKIYFDCHSKFNDYIAICSMKDDRVEFEEKDIFYNSVKIPEIEKIKDYKISLIFSPEAEINKCIVGYSSDDISFEEKTINLKEG